MSARESEPLLATSHALRVPIESSGESGASSPCDPIHSAINTDESGGAALEGGIDRFDETPGDRPSGISDFEGFLHIVKGNIGTGLLGLPFAFEYAGFLTGIFFMVFVAVVATACMQMLVKCSHRLCKMYNKDTLDYAGVGEYAVLYWTPGRDFHRLSKFVVNLFLCLTQIGFCCVYYLFVSANLKDVLKSCGVHFTQVEIVGMLAPLFMLGVMIRDLKTLAIFSGIANVLQVICIIIIIVFIGHRGFPYWSDVRYFPEKATDVALFFGLSMFSLEGIGVILPLENDVAKPGNFRRVIYTSMSVVSSNYIFMGAIGYACFPKDIKGSITLNLPGGDTAADIPYIYGKLFYAASIFLSFFLQFYVAADILEPRILKHVPQRGRKIGGTGFRIAMVFVAGGAAIGIPQLGLFISLVGAFGSSMLAMSFPPLLYCLVFWERMHPVQIARNFFLSFIGVVGMIVGTYSTCVELNKAFHPSPPANASNVTTW